MKKHILQHEYLIQGQGKCMVEVFVWAESREEALEKAQAGQYDGISDIQPFNVDYESAEDIEDENLSD